MFVVFEWVDASWKTTQLKNIVDYLQKRWKSFDVYDFPQYDKQSSFFVKEYLSGNFWGIQEVSAKQASIFYALDRFYSKKNIIESLKNKEYVLSNRYTSSNIVHQTIKLKDKTKEDEFIQWLKDFEYNVLWVPKPDKVLFFDMHIDIAWELNKNRWNGSWRDIHEKDYDYLKECYFTSLSVAKKLNWDIIKCYEWKRPYSINEIFQKILKYF